MQVFQLGFTFFCNLVQMEHFDKKLFNTQKQYTKTTFEAKFSSWPKWRLKRNDRNVSRLFNSVRFRIYFFEIPTSISIIWKNKCKFFNWDLLFFAISCKWNILTRNYSIHKNNIRKQHLKLNFQVGSNEDWKETTETFLDC